MRQLTFLVVAVFSVGLLADEGPAPEFTDPQETKQVTAAVELLEKVADNDEAIVVRQMGAMDFLIKVIWNTRTKYDAMVIPVESGITQLADPESPRLAKLLQQKLTAKNDGLRARAVYAMGLTNNYLAFGFNVYEQLKDPSPEVKFATMGALSNFASRATGEENFALRREIIGGIADEIKRQKNPAAFTIPALHAINQTGGLFPEAEKFWTSFLTEDLPEIRLEALTGLTAMNARNSGKEIRERTNDVDEKVAAQAVRALWAGENAYALADFHRLLSAPAELVRAEALNAIGYLYSNGDGKKPLLDRRLKEGRTDTQQKLDEFISSHPDDPKLEDAKRILTMIQQLPTA